MALKNLSVAIFVLAIAAFSAISMAAVYEVGDSAGWTSMGRVDYQDWASAEKFYPGDTLVFNYNNQFHNVKQVAPQDFESCNPTSPMATYNNGSDIVTLDRPGHYYFICGFPGHCLAGQKVSVSVTVASPSPRSSPSPSPSPSPSLSPNPPPTHSKLSPSSSGSRVVSHIPRALAVLSVVAIFF